MPPFGALGVGKGVKDGRCVGNVLFSMCLLFGTTMAVSFELLLILCLFFFLVAFKTQQRKKKSQFHISLLANTFHSTKNIHPDPELIKQSPTPHAQYQPKTFREKDYPNRCRNKVSTQPRWPDRANDFFPSLIYRDRRRVYWVFRIVVDPEFTRCQPRALCLYFSCRHPSFKTQQTPPQNFF